MKQRNLAAYNRNLFTLLVLTIFLAGCRNLLSPPPVNDGSAAPQGDGIGMAVVRIGSADGARTIMPSAPTFSRYELTFTRAGGTSVSVPQDKANGLKTGAVQVELAPGQWTVTVKAYQTLTASEATTYQAAEGSSTFQVSAGQPSAVTVAINPLAIDAANMPPGVFSFNITLPAGVSAAELSLDGSAAINLKTTASDSRELAAGIHDLLITLEKDGLFTGLYELVYIYPGLESKAELDLSDIEFSETVFLAGTVNASIPAGVAPPYTITAYSDAACQNAITGEGSTATVTSNGGVWLIKVPVSYIGQGQTVYLKAVAAGAMTGYAVDPVTETVTAIPAKGKVGIALTVTVRDIPPGEVTGLNGTFGNAQVTLAWIDPVDIDLDHIEITVTSPPGSNSPFTVAKGLETGIITGLSNGTAYTFTVKAVDKSGNKSEGTSTGSITPIVLASGLYEGISAVSGVADPFSLTNALTWLGANAVDNGEYTIVLNVMDFLSPTDLTGLNGADNVTITIRTVDATECIIRLSYSNSTGTLFTVGGASGAEGVKLILDGHLTLKGIKSDSNNNTVSLVRVNSTGTLEMKGNSKITDNRISESGSTYTTTTICYGGGVYVDGGSFTMSGSASVSDNMVSSDFHTTTGAAWSKSYGGGVYVSNGSFTMSGSASVSGNTASSRSTSTASNPNYYFDSSASDSWGGGVYIEGGNFTMSGSASVSGNTVKSESQSTESYAISYARSGGVYASVCDFTMSGSASVSGNTASSKAYSPIAHASHLSESSGGGMRVNGGSLTMSGNASVSGNTASSKADYSYAHGGEVYTTGNFTMSGKASVSGNTTSSEYFYSRASSAPYSYGGGVYTTGNFTMSDSATVSDNTNKAEGGGDQPSYGGGVYATGSFTMSGSATISGNTNTVSSSAPRSSSSGGGVYATGSFTMSGSAAVSDNTNAISATASYPSSSGGGVYAAGNFTMSGSAAVSGNTASSNGSFQPYSYGGGVYAGSNSSFTMSGSATVSGNTASCIASYDPSFSWGGGVSVGSNGSFTKTGGVIYGRNEGTNSNVLKTGGTEHTTGNYGVAIYESRGRWRNTTITTEQYLTKSGTSYTGYWYD
jgi:hypothetical protein